MSLIKDEKKGRQKSLIGILLGGALFALGISYSVKNYDDLPDDNEVNEVVTTPIKPCDEQITYKYFNDTQFERTVNASLPVPYMYFAYGETVFANYTVGDRLVDLKKLGCNNEEYDQDFVNEYLAKHGNMVYNLYAILNEDFNTTKANISAGSGVMGAIYFKPVEDNNFAYLNLTSSLSLGSHIYPLRDGGEEYISFMLLNSNLSPEWRNTNTTYNEYVNYYYTGDNEYILDPINLLIHDGDTFNMTILNHISGYLHVGNINPKNLRESTLGDYINQYNGGSIPTKAEESPSFPNIGIEGYKDERIINGSFLRSFLKDELE